MAEKAAPSLNPSPAPAEEPWTNLSQGEASLACQFLGSGYHLISENEWLTIAENILKVVGANDIDSFMDGLQLANGLNATSSAYILTNDNVIYDLAGEIGEWTDQTVTEKGCPEFSGEDEWQEYYEVVDYKGLNIAPAYYLTDYDNNIGRVRVGDSMANIRGFVRGYQGIYSLDLSQAPTTATSTIGFRCAR